MYPCEDVPDTYEVSEVSDLVNVISSLVMDLEEWTPEVLLPRRRELQVAAALLDRAVVGTQQLLAHPADD